MLIPQTAVRESGTMGVYKLSTFLNMPKEAGVNPRSSFTSTFIDRRFSSDYRKVQPSKSSLESPELDNFTTSREMISEDDSSVFTASTRTSNTISDDDTSLMDFARVSADFAPARHSTACCTDLALRRELRKRFHVEPALEEGGVRDSFAMGHSFRRELEKEDRVESLALWEETEPITIRDDRVVQKDTKPQSWHGDTQVSSASTRSNRALESFFRKSKKASFFNGFFSGLTFSSSRRSRKS